MSANIEPVFLFFILVTLHYMTPACAAGHTLERSVMARAWTPHSKSKMLFIRYFR